MMLLYSIALRVYEFLLLFLCKCKIVSYFKLKCFCYYLNMMAILSFKLKYTKILQFLT